jgi:hypothetical protein
MMGQEAFKIEKGIPIPRVGRPDKYPWEQLAVGESFLVPCAMHEIESVRNSLTSSRKGKQDRLGWKFTLRSNCVGVRVWRVK